MMILAMNFKHPTQPESVQTWSKKEKVATFFVKRTRAEMWLDTVMSPFDEEVVHTLLRIIMSLLNTST